MVVGGRLSAATDDEDYAAWIQAAFAGSVYSENRMTAEDLTEDTERLRTKYEQIALAAGRTCGTLETYSTSRNNQPTLNQSWIR